MSRKRILIIEDEIVIRTSLKKFLEKKQYKVTETGSLTEALQNDLQAFALIITDLRLPGPTGTDIIPLAAGVPVLVMTSYASVSSAVDIVATPLTKSNFRAKIIYNMSRKTKDNFYKTPLFRKKFWVKSIKKGLQIWPKYRRTDC